MRLTNRVLRSQPLHLSFFTLDDFEHALRHTLAVPRCSLLAEVHTALINCLRSLSSAPGRDTFIASLRETVDMGNPETSEGQPDIELLEVVCRGEGTKNDVLKVANGREGWESALVGYILEVSLAVPTEFFSCSNGQTFITFISMPP